MNSRRYFKLLAIVCCVATIPLVASAEDEQKVRQQPAECSGASANLEASRGRSGGLVESVAVKQSKVEVAEKNSKAAKILSPAKLEIASNAQRPNKEAPKKQPPPPPPARPGKSAPLESDDKPPKSDQDDKTKAKPRNGSKFTALEQQDTAEDANNDARDAESKQQQADWRDLIADLGAQEKQPATGKSGKNSAAGSRDEPTTSPKASLDVNDELKPVKELRKLLPIRLIPECVRSFRFHLTFPPTNSMTVSGLDITKLLAVLSGGARNSAPNPYGQLEALMRQTLRPPNSGPDPLEQYLSQLSNLKSFLDLVQLLDRIGQPKRQQNPMEQLFRL